MEVSLIRVIVRGFLKVLLQFETPLTVADADLDTWLPTVAQSHAEAMAAGMLGMIEIEFPDDPIEERLCASESNPIGW
jgi:hypothetical protein